MPAIRIPITKGNWTGHYQGGFYGDIRRSFNLDLERSAGKIELSEKHKVVFSDTSDTSFRRVEAFVRANLPSDSGVKYYATAFDGFDTINSRQAIYKSGDSNGDTGWALDTLVTPGSTNFSFQDLVSFPQTNAISSPNRLFATTSDTQVIYKPGTNGDTAGWQTYSNALSVMDSSNFHPLDVFQGTLLVGNLNTISTLDNVDSSVSLDRVVIPSQFRMHHIFHTPSRIWILSSNDNLEGMISEWDGFSIVPTRNYPIEGVPLTGVDFFGTPIVVTSLGQFLEPSGEAFVPIRDPSGNILALPVSTENGNSLLGSLSYPLDPSKFAIARRGFVVDGDIIRFNLSKSRTAKFGEFSQNSGGYVLDPISKRLYNSTSMGHDNGLGHGFEMRSGAYLKDLEGGIKLGSGRFYSNFDTSNVSVICKFLDVDDSSIQRGFAETQWINIPEPDAAWETLWIKHKKITDTNVKILAKARIEEGPFFMDTDIDLPNIAQVDFDDDTAFAVLLSATQDSLIVGDEIEVLAGPNAGKLAHITNISGAHGDTQVITIDESFDSSASLSAATFGRWKKLQTPDGDCSIIAGDSVTIHRFVIPSGIKNSPRISVKIEARGRVRDVSIEELALQYEINQGDKI